MIPKNAPVPKGAVVIMEDEKHKYILPKWMADEQKREREETTRRFREGKL